MLIRHKTNPCVYLKRCDLWNRFKTNTKKIWITNYCNGEKQSCCKLRSYRIHGCTVPNKLLPNGNYSDQ